AQLTLYNPGSTMADRPDAAVGPMSLLDPLDLASLEPAERASPRMPIPTRFVSSDEFLPSPQTVKQREVEARLKELGSKLARHQGMTRRRFFGTAAGMTSAFV